MKAVPDEVNALTRQAYDLLPRIKLPDLLLEVDSWAPYTKALAEIINYHHRVPFAA